jgi:hypothetical protein
MTITQIAKSQYVLNREFTAPGKRKRRFTRFGLETYNVNGDSDEWTLCSITIDDFINDEWYFCATRKPNPTPEWLERRFDSAERTVASWSEGKIRAAFRDHCSEEEIENIIKRKNTLF